MIQLGDVFLKLSKAVSQSAATKAGEGEGAGAREGARSALLKAALWWYSRASSLGHPLGSYYSGDTHTHTHTLSHVYLLIRMN